MSKKTLKRSLALGALMAFVITGQAWADSYIVDNNLNDTSAVVDATFDYQISDGRYGAIGAKNTEVSIVANDINVRGTKDATRLYAIFNETNNANNGLSIIANSINLGTKENRIGGTDAKEIRVVRSFKSGLMEIDGNTNIYATNGKAELYGFDLRTSENHINGDTYIDLKSNGRIFAINNCNASGAGGSKTVFAGNVTIRTEAISDYGYTDNLGVHKDMFGIQNLASELTIEGDTNIVLVDSTETSIEANLIQTLYNNDDDPIDTVMQIKGNTYLEYVSNGTGKEDVAAIAVSGSQLVLGSEDKSTTTKIVAKSEYTSEIESEIAGIIVQDESDISVLGSHSVTVDLLSNSTGDVCGIMAREWTNGKESGSLDLSTTNITAVSNGSGYVYGINGKAGADIHLADTTITATSKEGIAYGIYTDNSTADVTGDLTVTATSYNVARGVEARNGSQVTIGNAEKSNNVTINAVGTNANASDDWVIGVFSRHDDSQVDIKGDTVTINASATGTNMASSILANTTTDNGEQAVLNIEANNIILTADATADGKAAAITTMSGSETNIKGNLTATADKVIYTRGNATTIINESGNDTVVLNGDIVYAKGYTDNDNINATVEINLNNAESVFNGAIYTQSIEGERNTFVDQVTAGTTLGLSNGATWNVKGESFVNTLQGDGGVINVETVEDGLVNVDTDNSTNLTVNGTSAIADSIANGETNLQALANTVKTGDVSAADVVTTAEGEIAGAYSATLTDGVIDAGSVTEATNTVNDSIGEASVALKAHWRAHMNDMNKRMGELRNANGEHGVWTRMVRGESEYEGVKAQYNQYQLGYDEKLSVDKRWTVGAAVTFSEGDSSFGKGSTEDDSTAFAIYGSKLNTDGTFVDLIARYARLESDITMGNATSDYSTNGMSVSAEFGKRIQQGNGLWIEPQVELTYGTVDSADYVIDGKKVQVGDMDSIIGRVGFSLGKDIKQGNVYARASYLYDFDGETETSFSKDGLSRTIEEDLGGGWWEVGVGANINLSKATYIYADVEKTFGGEVDTNWQWNLGVRYSF